MVGLSGGKDSWALLQILDDAARSARRSTSRLVAVNVDSGYKGYKHDVIADDLRRARLGVPSSSTPPSAR